MTMRRGNSLAAYFNRLDFEAFNRVDFDPFRKE